MKTDSGSFFVDANVLVYAAIADDPRHKAAKDLLMDPGGTLHISPQIITEFYSTITSPKRVAAPYPPLEAIEFLETLLGYEHVSVLPITAAASVRLLELLRDREVKGPQVFDLQIAATMLAHGVTRLFTYNGSDFKQIPDLEVLEPTDGGKPIEEEGSEFKT